MLGLTENQDSQENKNNWDNVSTLTNNPVISKDSCIGLLGKLFGHKFIATYDTDIDRYSAKEIDQIHESEIRKNGGPINAGAAAYLKVTSVSDKPKRYTKVFNGCYCQRCGKQIKPENIKL